MNNTGLTIFDSELIPVYTTDTGEKVVIGRELHEKLEIKTPYNKWLPRMIEYGFEEEKDYSTILSTSAQNNGSRPSIEYIMKFDMAKHIAMIQRSEIGRLVGKHLDDMDKKLAVEAAMIKVGQKAESAEFDAGKQFLGIVEAAVQSDGPQTFLFEDYQLRTCAFDENPWFVGKDVAEILKYENPSKTIRDHVDPEDKKMGVQGVTPSIIDNLGRKQYPTFINESGLYSLILKSKLPTAKKFKRWVTSDVIPAIRKSGTYSVPKVQQDSYMIPDPIERAKAWIKEEEKRQLLEKENQKLLETNSVMKPKSEYYDRIVEAGGLTNFRDFAKQSGIKEKDLMQFLTSKGYIYRDTNGNIRPKAGKSEGILVLKDFVNSYNGYYGKRTLITPEGKLELLREYEKDGLPQRDLLAIPKLELKTGKSADRYAKLSKPVRCVETGTVFGSINAAARSVNRKGSSLTHAINHNGICGGYHWELVTQ